MKKMLTISMLLLIGLTLNVTAKPKHIAHSEFMCDVGSFDVSKTDLQSLTPIFISNNSYLNCEVYVNFENESTAVFTFEKLIIIANNNLVATLHEDPGSVNEFLLLNKVTQNRSPKTQKLYILNCTIKQCSFGGYSLTLSA